MALTRSTCAGCGPNCSLDLKGGDPPASIVLLRQADPVVAGPAGSDLGTRGAEAPCIAAHPRDECWERLTGTDAREMFGLVSDGTQKEGPMITAAIRPLHGWIGARLEQSPIPRTRWPRGVGVTGPRRTRRLGASGLVAATIWLGIAAPAAVARWSVQPTAKPPGDSNSLDSVSCAARTACTAVGTALGEPFGGSALAEHWNGARWSIQHPPRPHSTDLPVFLNAVSCASTIACTATGVGPLHAVADSWNGLAWSGQQTARLQTITNLQGVSCVTAGDCMAVGWAHSPAALAERWDGVLWSPEQTPKPAHSYRSNLADVSCVAVSACMAVGSTNRAGREVTLAERWDGTGWRILNTPDPGRGRAYELNSVSCGSRLDCIAVGDYASAAHHGALVPLAEGWNGSRWTVQQTPRPTDATNGNGTLSGVSCVSPRACLTVGSYVIGHNTDHTLAERWNGTRWTVQKTPNPAHGSAIYLSDVSCVAVTACIAVGDFYRGLTDLPLIERYS